MTNKSSDRNIRSTIFGGKRWKTGWETVFKSRPEVKKDNKKLFKLQVLSGF